jgi:copper chaperone CopZ
MRTLLLTAAVALAFGACAKDTSKPADTSNEQAAAKVAPAPSSTPTAQADEAAVSCDTPGEAGEEGMCGKQEEAGGCNKWDAEAAAVTKRDVPDNAVWKTLKVAGMTCGGCERRVIAHVGKLDGVVSVEADSELGQVRIALASKHGDSAEAATAEIKRLGYRVE